MILIFFKNFNELALFKVSLVKSPLFLKFVNSLMYLRIFSFFNSNAKNMTIIINKSIFIKIILISAWLIFRLMNFIFTLILLLVTQNMHANFHCFGKD